MNPSGPSAGATNGRMPEIWDFSRVRIPVACQYGGLPDLRTPHFRLTMRQMMALVVVAAIQCAFWTSMYKCEARRPLMYQQRDVTRAIMLEAQQDLAAVGHSTAEIRNERPRGTYSYEWTEWLEAWEIRGGQKRPLIRATVSGNNGQFALSADPRRDVRISAGCPLARSAPAGLPGEGVAVQGRPGSGR